MAQFFREGGFPMFFILAFALIALAAAARFAVRPAREQLPFVRSMSLAALFATLAGTAADLGATCHHIVQRDELRNNPQWYFHVLQGIGESMSPAVLGFPLLALTSLLIAVGAARAPEQAG